MSKIKLGVVFGGMSTEHNVSVVSGTSVIQNLNKNKYDIYPIFIDKNGIWHKHKIEDKIENAEKIENVFEYLKNLDVIFPVLHGLYGEDGTIQGFFELLKIPYVGCKVLGSSIGMDKVYTKIIFDKAQIKQAKYEYIRKNEDKYIYVSKNFEEKNCSLEEICNILNENIKFPMFIKPSNSGSSIGINKASNLEELKKYIEYASNFDNKILIEENIVGKEIECSVLGNENVNVSCLGEIFPAEDFYSFDAKYKNSKSKLTIPAILSEETTKQVQNLAKKAFKAIDGKGLARVDFFVNEETKEIFINEINTSPGFTQISMYPKLWENTGIRYEELLEKIIELAIKKEQD